MIMITNRVHALMRAIRAEIFSPEILWYQESLVNDLKTVVKTSQSVIDGLKDRAPNVMDDNHMSHHMEHTLYEMEIERVRYLIARYLRTRIIKIESSLHYIDSNIDTKDRLSSEEKKFVSNIKKLYDGHMEEIVFSRIKDNVAEDVFYKPKADSGERSIYRDNVKNDQPNLNEFVVCRTIDDDLDINLQFNNESKQLVKNSIHVIEYSDIQKHILIQPADPDQTKLLKRFVTDYFKENGNKYPSAEELRSKGEELVRIGRLEMEELEKFIKTTCYKLELV